MTPGQQHESTRAIDLLEHVQGHAVIADTAFDSDAIRAAIKAKGLKPVIAVNPSRKNRVPLNRRLYRLRYRVEVFFHSLKRFRRAATRYEKTTRNYLGFLHVGCALLWLSQGRL